MRKKIVVLGLAVAVSLPVFAKREIVMLIVPREPVPVRVGQDIALNYPTLLVTYKKTGDKLEIHGWTGERWVGIHPENYKIGNFFTNAPSRCILVESAEKPAPAEMIPDGSWCMSGHRLSSTDPRVMLHMIGRDLNFSYSIWKLYANAYNLTMEQINPGLVNVPWYHYKGNELTYYRRRSVEQDFSKWSTLNIIPPAEIEPAIFEEEYTEGTLATKRAVFMETPAPAIDEETPAVIIGGEAPAPVAKEDVAVAAIRAEAPASTVIVVREETPAFTVREIPPAVIYEETPATALAPAAPKYIVVREAAPAAVIYETDDSFDALFTDRPADVDPFSGEPIPPAEVIAPSKPKKSWWKIF